MFPQTCCSSGPVTTAVAALSFLSLLPLLLLLLPPPLLLLLLLLLFQMWVWYLYDFLRSPGGVQPLPNQANANYTLPCRVMKSAP
jgi:hypothetical protein